MPPKLKPRRPAHKKSVSFSDAQSSHSQSESQPQSSSTFLVGFSPKLIPIHLLMIFYSIFTSDSLSPDQIHEVLVFHLYLLTFSQLLFAVIFNNCIIESRKGKQPQQPPQLRNLKFNVHEEYHLILIGLIVCALSTPFIYIALVTFGAPFSTYINENFLLASHISLLCYPMVVTSLKMGKVDPFLYKYVASVAIGAWVGAIAIPLDWDRPWQNWPLPIVGGAYLGSSVGYLVGWAF